MNAQLLGLLIQLAIAGITEVPAIVAAIQALMTAHPEMTAAQIGALCQGIALDVATTTAATDAKLDAVDTTKPPGTPA